MAFVQVLALLVSVPLACLFRPIHATPAVSFDTASYSPSFILKRDVAILGGGSSGTYAAIALHDRNLSVAVIEKQNYLGGHTNTYTDPASGKKVNYGVLVFDNTDPVKRFFARFNIPLTLVDVSAATAQLKKSYIDFRTGKSVSGYTPADPRTAFGAYGAQLAKYPYLVAPGYNLPDPVPSDLLIPFGDFVKKYQIDDAVFSINEYAQGFGNLLEIPTLYVLKYFGASVLEGSQTGFLTTARGDNGELYEKAGQVLGDKVLLSSTVLATLRNDDGVKLVLQTPQGLKLLIAKKLIISAPPLLANLAGFDLSDQERSLFKQWTNGAYYTSLVSDTGIPDNVDITNVGADTLYNLPTVPAAYGISPTLVPGLKNILFGSSQPLGSDADVKSAILASIQRIKGAGSVAGTTASNPKFVAYNNHTPYELRVSSDAIKSGFYSRLNALQGAKGGAGGKSTWYTGAAFDRHDSGDLWAFTETIVQQLVKA